MWETQHQYSLHPCSSPGMAPTHHHQQYHHLSQTRSANARVLPPRDHYLHHHHHHHHQQVGYSSGYQEEPPRVVYQQPRQQVPTQAPSTASVYQQQHQAPASVPQMDVVSHCSNPRASRNLAEKQRRDNLNAHIATMAALVPAVSSGNSRKKDKISVLRLTAAHLRLAFTLGRPSSDGFLPRKFNDIDLENCLIESFSGPSSFLMLLTTAGKIVYISKHVEQHLGHDQSDMLGDSIQSYIYKEDHPELMKALSTDDCFPRGNNPDSHEENSNSSEDSAPRPDYSTFKSQRRSFHVRMAQRTNSRREPIHYEFVQISGVLRLASECQIQIEQNAARREHSSTSNDVILVSTARLLKKRTITELSLLEANKNEYFTRHLVDGRIVFCDHRISFIAGYMSEEVSGTSAFKFMHKDDVRWTMVALRDMYDHGKNYGSSCYRLKTKTGDFIYLRTHGYLEYDETTQTVASFICINTLTAPEEGEGLIVEMKKRFSATISVNSTAVKAIRGKGKPTISTDSDMLDIPSVEDPEDLDEAITGLISHLPNQILSEECMTSNSLPNTQLVKAAMYSQQLPPISIQASRIGINAIENTVSFIGKGGKGGKGKGSTGKQNPTDSSGSQPKSNGERRKPIADKKIEKLEAALRSPPCTIDEKSSVEEIQSPSSTVTTNTYRKLEENVPQEKTSLKRTHSNQEFTEDDCPKKKTEKVESFEFVSIADSAIDVKEELRFQTFINDQSVPYDTNLPQIESNFPDIDTDPMVAASSENQFISFQDEQLLHSAMENNSAETAAETNVYPFPATDHFSVNENEARHTHLQIPHSISSSESQFSDIDDQNNVQLPYDSFT